MSMYVPRLVVWKAACLLPALPGGPRPFQVVQSLACHELALLHFPADSSAAVGEPFPLDLGACRPLWRIPVGGLGIPAVVSVRA